MIRAFCEKLNFPQEATEVLYATYQDLLQNSENVRDLKIAEEKLHTPWDDDWELYLHKVAERSGVRQETVDMILLLMAMLLSGIGHGLDYVIARNSVSREAITSPDGRYTLVLEQQTFYHTKSCTAYLMTSSVTMKKLGSWQWDIATCPEVTWEGDHVAVRGDGKTKYFCLED